MHPTSAQPAQDELVPIHVVAQEFGLNPSALRYYERRGLLEPASRHGGRRWYGPREIRRLAIIQFWQRGAMMSLDAIEKILDRSSPGGDWQEIVVWHLEEMRAKIEQLQRVETCVSQALKCEYHDCLDDCPNYERAVWETLDLTPSENSDAIVGNGISTLR